MTKTTNPQAHKAMKIKIQDATIQRIEDALKVVNGRAERHAFTTYREVATVAMDAETRAGQARRPEGGSTRHDGDHGKRIEAPELLQIQPDPNCTLDYPPVGWLVRDRRGGQLGPQRHASAEAADTYLCRCRPARMGATDARLRRRGLH